MSQFYNLTVTDIEKNTNDSVVVTLDVPEHLEEQFRFRAGQYLTFKYAFEGEELRRSYSICTSEQSRSLRIGIKKVEGGAFSGFANDVLQINDQLEVMPPDGRFVVEGFEDGARLLMVAAGSGITPILAQIETVLARTRNTKITLIYGNKTPLTTMFRDRIDELKSLYMARLSVVHVLSASPQDIDLFSGRITGERCRTILENWVGRVEIDGVFICGPEEMVLNIRDMMQNAGINPGAIKYELFNSPKRKNGRAVSATKRAKDVELTVILDGTAHHFDMSQDQSVLEVARENRLDAPFSCEGGICSTCRCRILEGKGEMEINHALEDYEIEAGYALSCQLVPSGKKLVISYDEGH